MYGKFILKRMTVKPGKAVTAINTQQHASIDIYVSQIILIKFELLEVLTVLST